MALDAGSVVGELVLKYKGDDYQRFSRDARAADKDVRGVGDASRKTQTDLDAHNKSVDKAGHSYGALKTAAAGAAVGGIYVLGKAFMDGVSTMAENMRINAQTRAAIASTGGAANVTAKQVQQLADSITEQTGVSDEAIKTAENLLLTFTNVRNEVGLNNDIFNQATVSAVDMSVALGTDLQSATLQLGKALNDPIKGMTALQRVGVAFTEEQKAVIKAMVESGHAAGAQKIILGELNTEFGKSAEAAGKTLPGQIDILKEKWEDITVNLAQRAVPAITAATDALTEHWPEIQRGAEQAFDVIETGASAAVDAFGLVNATAGEAVRTLGVSETVLGVGAWLVLGRAISAVQTRAVAAGTAITAQGGLAMALRGMITPATLLQGALTLGALAVYKFSQQQDQAEKAVKGLSSAIRDQMDATRELEHADLAGEQAKQRQAQANEAVRKAQAEATKASKEASAAARELSKAESDDKATTDERKAAKDRYTNAIAAQRVAEGLLQAALLDSKAANLDVKDAEDRLRDSRDKARAATREQTKQVDELNDVLDSERGKLQLTATSWGGYTTAAGKSVREQKAMESAVRLVTKRLDDQADAHARGEPKLARLERALSNYISRTKEIPSRRETTFLLRMLEANPGRGLDWAVRQMGALQRFDGMSASVNFDVRRRGGAARGERIDERQVIEVGEDADQGWEEYVIPTKPTYRDRGKALLSAAARRLGVPGFAAGGVVGRALDDANYLAGLRLPYNMGGGHSSPASSPPSGMDCSATVSHVLQRAGLLGGTVTTDGLMGWGIPSSIGDPSPLKVFVRDGPGNQGHTFMQINGRGFGTSGARGPMWLPYSSMGAPFIVRKPPAGTLGPAVALASGGRDAPIGNPYRKGTTDYIYWQLQHPPKATPISPAAQAQVAAGQSRGVGSPTGANDPTYVPGVGFVTGTASGDPSKIARGGGRVVDEFGNPIRNEDGSVMLRDPGQITGNEGDATGPNAIADPPTPPPPDSGYTIADVDDTNLAAINLDGLAHWQRLELYRAAAAEGIPIYPNIAANPGDPHGTQGEWETLILELARHSGRRVSSILSAVDVAPPPVPEPPAPPPGSSFSHEDERSLDWWDDRPGEAGGVHYVGPGSGKPDDLTDKQISGGDWYAGAEAMLRQDAERLGLITAGSGAGYTNTQLVGMISGAVGLPESMVLSQYRVTPGQASAARPSRPGASAPESFGSGAFTGPRLTQGIYTQLGDQTAETRAGAYDPRWAAAHTAFQQAGPSIIVNMGMIAAPSDPRAANEVIVAALRGAAYQAPRSAQKLRTGL